MTFSQNCLHLQFTTMGCLRKALDDVLDTSMTLASNLLLNRRDKFLKLCHRDVTDKDIARLRNASLTKKELFNSKVLSEVEQNFIQWSQINRETAFKKHRGNSYGSRSFADSKKDQGPRWQSGNTLASHLCGRGSIPVMAVSGKAGSCMPLVGSLQYTTLANSMYWFPLPFQLPVVI